MKNNIRTMEKHLLAIKEIIRSLYKKHKLSFATTWLDDCVSRDTVKAFNIDSQWNSDMTIGEMNKIRYEFDDKIREYSNGGGVGDDIRSIKEDYEEGYTFENVYGVYGNKKYMKKEL